jgi:phosphatidylserine/phosphatidylglycerophosphate/cardiolipin synthase-like enzyme
MDPPQPKLKVAPEKSRTPILDAIQAELEDVSPGLEEVVWERTPGNELDDPWILQVPDCWGQSVVKVNTGIDRLLKKVQDNIAGATRCVDITGWGIPSMPLAPARAFPDGRFAQAIGAGLKSAADARPATGATLKVRVLTGTPAGGIGAWPGAFLKELQAMVGANADRIDFYVAAMATRAPTSQNHTKFVVVDGISVIHGGINWMSSYYIEDGGWNVGGWGGKAPVTDIDIALRGPAATSAGKFLDKLWKWTCDNLESKYVSLATSKDKSVPPELYAQEYQPLGQGELDVISVGSLGYGIQLKDDGSTYKLPGAAKVEQAACGSNNETNTDRDFATVNPDANAIRVLIANAKKTVVLSQQDINGYSHYPMNHALFDVRLVDVIVDRILADPPVEVRIVLSTPGYPDYSNINSIEEAAKALLDRVMLKVGSEEKARKLLQNQLALVTLRVSNASSWPDGLKYRLHSKLVCVDSRAFYVGSRNAYPDTTQDHGFIIEDEAAAMQLKTQFLDKQWLYSNSTAYKWDRSI